MIKEQQGVSLNLKTWTRGIRGKLLILGFLPVIAVTAVGITADLGIVNLQLEIKHAYEEEAPALGYVGVMDANLHAMMRWSWSIISLSSQSEDIRKDDVGRIEGELKGFREALTAYEALPQSVEKQEVLARIQQKQIQFQDEFNSLRPLLERVETQTQASNSCIRASAR